MSFLKNIVKPEAGIPEQWLLNPDAAYRMLSDSEKAYYMMQLAVLISYLNKVYGDEGLPKILDEYKKHVINEYFSELKKLYFKGTKDTRNPYVNLAYPNVEILLGLNPGKLDAAECTRVLSVENNNVPNILDASFYAPYVLFVERTFGLDRYIDSNYISNSRSFTVGSAVSIPSFRLVGKNMTVRYEIVFPSYQFNYSQIGKLATTGVAANSILSYWAGYNWRGKTFSGVMGVLAAQCLEKDANAIPKRSNMWGYLDVYRKVIALSPYADQSNSLALSSLETTLQRRSIIKFLCYIREHFNTTFDDKQLLSNFLSNVDANDAQLHDFFNANSAKEVSVETYNAFKKSCFSTFSELDVVINGRTGLNDRSGSLNAKKTKESEDADAQQEKPEESESQGGENPEGAAPESSGSTGEPAASNVFDGPDASTTLENQDSSDATDEEGKSENEPDPNDPKEHPAGDDPDKAPDEELNNPDESSSGNEKSNNKSHTHTKLSIPKLDDKKGVKLSLSEGESTNSVLYREELEAYIDSLLANPPSILSVQTISALERLKAYWLYMMPVDQLHDWLRAMIRLPKSITIKK